MASRNRIRRLVRLIDLLTSGRAHSVEQLAELCSVSRRTIFRDLEVLRDADLIIRYNEERGGLELERPPFLRPTDFTISEALSLLILAGVSATSDRGLPFHSAAHSASLKLLSSLPHKLRQHLGELADRTEVRIGPRNSLAGNAIGNYQLLNFALKERRQVRLRYRSLYEQSEIGTLLSPYHILFHTRSWYVIGRSSLHRSVRTFNVGRIASAELLESQYEIPSRFRLDRYFGNAWSMIRNRNERHQVLVRFQRKVAQNVIEVQWHRTQCHTLNKDGSVDVTFDVEGLHEISWWIMGYGKEAEVFRPPELRAILREHVQQMAFLYQT